MERPKCSCFTPQGGQGDALVDTVGAALTDQLIDALDAVCDEAGPYVIATWMVSVGFAWGFRKEYASRPDRKDIDPELVGKGVREALKLVPEVLEQRLGYLVAGQLQTKGNA